MGQKKIIKDFNENESFWAGILRDFLAVILVVCIFSSLSYVALGRWSPMVAVESESMIPYMQIGDIVFIQGIDRTDIITHEKGKEIGYITKGDNNQAYDQMGSVSYLKPVRKEWIIGVTRFYRVPLLGYINLIPRKALGI
jgi:signal peptidase